MRKDMDAACEHIDERLTPFYPTFIREVTKEDILKLMEIKMATYPEIQLRQGRGTDRHA